MPGTSPMPSSRALAEASAQPAVWSWSVNATTSSPAAAAAVTRSAGDSVPSEMCECV